MNMISCFINTVMRKKQLLFVLPMFALLMCKHKVEPQIDFVGLERIVYTVDTGNFVSLFFLSNLQKTVDSLQLKAADYQIHAIKLFQISQSSVSEKTRQLAYHRAISHVADANATIEEALNKQFLANNARFDLYRQNINKLKPSNDLELLEQINGKEQQAISHFASVAKEMDSIFHSIDTLINKVRNQQQGIKTIIEAYGLCLQLSKTGLKLEIERNQHNLYYRIIKRNAQTPVNSQILKEEFVEDSIIYLSADYKGNNYLFGSFNSIQEAYNYCNRNSYDTLYVRLDIGSQKIDLKYNNTNANNSHVYRIQIYAMKEPISDEEYKKLLKIHQVIKVEQSNGVYKYYIGAFHNHNEAVNFKLNKALNNGFVVVEKNTK